MPWLVQEQDAPSPEEAVLFVHIPRSGGTSLNADYNVPAQTKRGRHCMHRALLTYFFYRYKLLERSNFPFRSWENLYVACSLSVAAIIDFLFTIAPRLKGEIWYHPLDCVHMGLCTLPYVMIGSASLTFFLNTFVATAPSLRSDNLRRFYLWFWHLTGAYSTSVISGTNKNGFLMHLTAEEMVRHGYVTEAQLMCVSSFAIVRRSGPPTPDQLAEKETPPGLQLTGSGAVPGAGAQPIRAHGERVHVQPARPARELQAVHPKMLPRLPEAQRARPVGHHPRSERVGRLLPPSADALVHARPRPAASWARTSA